LVLLTCLLEVLILNNAITAKSRVATFLIRPIQMLLPLRTRLKCVIWLGKCGNGSYLSYLQLSLIRDWANECPDAYHHFLWSHNLGYANWYKKKNEFGAENVQPVTRMIFEDLKKYLANNLGDFPVVKSVFDVGCSWGFLLRFFETDLFPDAEKLEGNDINKKAIEEGREYLRQHQSRITLFQADISDIDRIMDGSKYDLVTCIGVIIYLNEPAATALIRSMLNHCTGLVVISSIAHPYVDNSQLENTAVRNVDGAFLHNLDRLVKNAGGRVLKRRWEGPKTFGGQTMCYVFCEPEKPVF
jgi:2-polyprenyl-3-methyl-5-hydroxy-6-metoxy-1,4-benzoquinol methylase